jgi:hypothetical protein
MSLDQASERLLGVFATASGESLKTFFIVHG